METSDVKKWRKGEKMRCVCNGGVQRVRREGSLSVWLSWIGSRCAHGKVAQKGIQRTSLLSGPYLKLLHLFQHQVALMCRK